METEDAIRARSTPRAFDPERGLDAEEVRELVALACRAPSSFNLQPWRFVVVEDSDARARLVELSGEARLGQAPVVLIVLGDLRANEDLAEALVPSVERGDLDPEQARAWSEQADRLCADPRRARDEATRSAGMAVATLMLAATSRGLTTLVRADFDLDGVREEFGVTNRFLPVALVALGHPAAGEPGPQKVRRGLGRSMVEGDARELGS